MEIGRTGRVQVEDIVFLVRKDQRKYARVKDLLTMNEELKKARKAFDEVKYVGEWEGWALKLIFRLHTWNIFIFPNIFIFLQESRDLSIWFNDIMHCDLCVSSEPLYNFFYVFPAQHACLVVKGPHWLINVSTNWFIKRVYNVCSLLPWVARLDGCIKNCKK